MEIFEETSFRFLSVAVMAPVVSYLLIKPHNPFLKDKGQIVKAVTTIFISALILAATTSSNWHVSHAQIQTQYSAYNSCKYHGALTIKIGLSSAIIHLKGSVPDLALNSVESSEKITLYNVEPKYQQRDALQRGLPFPILTALEYLTWFHPYHQASSYVTFFLWCAFAFWLLTTILWSVDTFYCAFCLSITGCLLLLSNIIFSFNLPNRALVIPLEGKMMHFSYGSCYYISIIVGSFCLFFGACTLVSSYHGFLAITDKFKPWREQLKNSYKIHDSILCCSQRSI